MRLTIHVDGGSRGNPGPAGAGVVIRTEDGAALFEGAFFLGRQTNNAAEYYGLIHGLQQVTSFEAEYITIHADSELLVRQITGEYRVKSPSLAKLYEQVQMLLLKLPRWKIRHVRREFNKRADELANLAMDRRANVIVRDSAGAEGECTPTDAVVDEPETVSSSAADTQVLRDAGHAAAGPRLVRVVAVAVPNPDVCPAAATIGEGFTVGTTLPAGLCIYAAHALLPTLLAIHGTEPQEFAAIPTMTVRCANPACGAVFQVSPVKSPNGRGRP
ncbi:MAG: reverse transcriptase-like protein [Phycisphaerae bacterium]|nr:reverse transcriptase-like protein [Phycisphaerae bacterium]